MKLLINKKISVLFILLVIIIGGCKKENNLLYISEKSVVLGANIGLEHLVRYETNATSVQIIIPEDASDWCSAETVKGELIKITATPNLSLNENRTTKLTIKAGNAIPQTINIMQLSVKETVQKKLLSFILPANLNQLKTDITGIINDDNGTITIETNQWIENAKHLIARFETFANVYVNEMQQESGITENSYLTDLVFTMKSEDGTEKQYTVITKGAMFTGLPVISINIDENKEVVEKTEKLSSVMSLLAPDNDAFDMFSEMIIIRGRGNTTWDMPKKPYRIDFSEKTSVFGLPAAKKWVLLANYQDPTLLMNDVTFELGQRFDVEYTHASIHVELFINGNYRGNYQLTEQNEIGKGRVNIDKKQGFLLEMDAYFDEDYKFKTNYFQLPVMITDPDLNNESEMEPIKLFIQNFENSLFSPGFPNNNYEEYTDVNSLIDFMLVNEIVKNAELYHPKSIYCYKDTDTKIKWGPLWDFDWAFSYNSVQKNYFGDSKGVLFKKGTIGNYPGIQFFNRFMEIPEFRAKYKSRWNEVKPQALSILSYIDTKKQQLDKSQTENFKLSEAIPPTKTTTYNNLITQMKQFLADRINYLDAEINKF